MSTRILIGHVLDKLAELPERSVHMVWTSPPYWGLRSYGTEPQVWGGEKGCAHEWGDSLPPRPGRGNKPGDYSMSSLTNPKRQDELPRPTHAGCFCVRCTAWRGEHGLEPSFDLWLAHEVEIFRAVRRVLRDDGTVWINVGDAYASSPNGISAAETKAKGDDRAFRDRPIDTTGGQFKPKDRILMPARLAVALHEDGWWLRDEIVWSKANPMPSSVRDRTTPAHEMIYMLSKKGRYFYDRMTIAEPIAESSHARYDQETLNEQTGGFKQEAYENNSLVGQRAKSRRPAEILKALADGDRTRNKRSVWHMALEPFVGAHFATAPTGIVRPCILAGTSAKGVCPHCGAPWVRVTEVEYKNPGNRSTNGPRSLAQRHQTAGFPVRLERRDTTTGWQPTCACADNEPVPATVLDPFGGAGTTALVAQDLGRVAILIELNPEYAEIARSRLRQALHRVESDMPERRNDMPLFTVSGETDGNTGHLAS